MEKERRDERGTETRKKRTRKSSQRRMKGEKGGREWRREGGT